MKDTTKQPNIILINCDDLGYGDAHSRDEQAMRNSASNISAAS